MDFKPGQEWLTRDGVNTFRIISVGSDKVFCVCTNGKLIGIRFWIYANSGQFWRNMQDNADLTTLVKDV